MNKKTIAAIVSSLLLLAACHKDNKEPSPTGDGYWRLFVRRTNNNNVDSTYSIHYTSRSTNNGYAVLSGMDFSPGRPADFLQLWFKQLPVAGGQYKIVLFPKAAALGENEMGLTISMSSQDSYTSTGIGSNATWLPPANAVVSVTGGKITAAIPQMMVMWTNSAAMRQDSSFLFGGVLIEK